MTEDAPNSIPRGDLGNEASKESGVDEPTVGDPGADDPGVVELNVHDDMTVEQALTRALRDDYVHVTIIGQLPSEALSCWTSEMTYQQQIWMMMKAAHAMLDAS